MYPRVALYAWADRAACQHTNPEYWDLETHAHPARFHRDMCCQCPVLAQCARSARIDKAHSVIRAGVACRRATPEQRADTDEALARIELAALIADGVIR